MATPRAQGGGANSIDSRNAGPAPLERLLPEGLIRGLRLLDPRDLVALGDSIEEQLTSRNQAAPMRRSTAVPVTIVNAGEVIKRTEELGAYVAEVASRARTYAELLTGESAPYPEIDDGRDTQPGLLPRLDTNLRNIQSGLNVLSAALQVIGDRLHD